MQNRNRGGFEVATVFNNDTPLMGPIEMVRVQSESLTMVTDVVNWRKIDRVYLPIRECLIKHFVIGRYAKRKS